MLSENALLYCVCVPASTMPRFAEWRFTFKVGFCSRLLRGEWATAVQCHFVQPSNGTEHFALPWWWRYARVAHQSSRVLQQQNTTLFQTRGSCNRYRSKSKASFISNQTLCNLLACQCLHLRFLQESCYNHGSGLNMSRVNNNVVQIAKSLRVMKYIKGVPRGDLASKDLHIEPHGDTPHMETNCYTISKRSLEIFNKARVKQSTNATKSRISFILWFSGGAGNSLLRQNSYFFLRLHLSFVVVSRVAISSNGK